MNLVIQSSLYGRSRSRSAAVAPCSWGQGNFALVRLIRSRPLAHPDELRLCRTALAGSIPAGDILEIGKRIAETGKIVRLETGKRIAETGKIVARFEQAGHSHSPRTVIVIRPETRYSFQE
jgi:hypothetical protein